MSVKALFRRSVDYFRGTEVRATSLYTLNKGLIKLYLNGDPQLKDKIESNIRHRILSGRISIEELMELSEKFVRKLLNGCGLTVENITYYNISNALEAKNLIALAQKTNAADILNGLAENPELKVKEATAKNRHAPWQTVAKIIIQLLEADELDDARNNYDRYDCDPHDAEMPYEFEYAKRIGLARDILMSRSLDERRNIMAEVEKENAEIAWGINLLERDKG